MAFLTDLAKVKTHLGESGTGLDSILPPIIDAVDQLAEKWLGRPLEKKARTEVIPRVRRFQEMITLRAAPVDTGQTFDVYYDGDRDFPAASLVDADNYTVNGPAGTIHFDSRLNEGFRIYQVVYTGGLVTDADDAETNYPALNYGANLQAAEWWRRRKTMGATTTTKTGASKVFTGQGELLDAVKILWNPYRRLRFH